MDLYPPKHGRAANLVRNIGLFFFSSQTTKLFVPLSAQSMIQESSYFSPHFFGPTVFEVSTLVWNCARFCGGRKMKQTQSLTHDSAVGACRPHFEKH